MEEHLKMRVFSNVITMLKLDSKYIHHKEMAQESRISHLD